MMHQALNGLWRGMGALWDMRLLQSAFAAIFACAMADAACSACQNAAEAASACLHTGAVGFVALPARWQAGRPQEASGRAHAWLGRV